MIRMGVIGYGYWGPNIVRNFRNQEGVKVVAVCDSNPATLKKIGKSYPDIHLCSDSRKITTAPDIDAVAIVTPVSTHFGLAWQALSHSKHVFVEKPLSTTAAEAEELVNLARKHRLILMVDHTFIFTGAVRKIKQLIDSNALGPLYYYDSTRVNLGLFQHDVNVIWDLAPHDFSIMDYLIQEKPQAIAATGASHLNSFEDVAYVVAYFQSKMIAHFNVNWLSPVKIRKTLIGGEKRMLVWNDLSADEKIKVYDKGVDVNDTETIHSLLISYRSGDMLSPRLDNREALSLECSYFVDCVEKNETPFNDGESGYRVVKMLEATSESLKRNGEFICL